MATEKPRRASTAPTIYDVARLAGVNPSTVSRALNTPGRINARTEEKVHAAARELRYRSNPMARALPTGRTSTIGLILSDITNPMIAGIVRGAATAADALGYTVVIAESQESPELESRATERIVASVDGVILAASRLDDASITELAGEKPLVLINRALDGVESVIGEVRAGIEEAVAHLQLLGHTRIVYLAGPSTSWMSRHRAAVIQDVASGRGIDIEVVGPNVPTLEGGAATLSRLVAMDATAVMAYNDVMAIGLLRAAAEQGFDVPSQMSIVGFDDVFGSDFTHPPLTTIRMPLLALGELAVHRILEAVGVETATEPAAAPIAQLVVRGSTARPRA
ncbi:LacI family DNA-binding transcriptional regulator [Agrococcus jejuensis]|uniref:Transcriptional regulator, LacI family n=1 Tax=Agrococcus jejuensis TaxID=399736 RepID=A0A1G8DVG4_9MICO|nr:LacI family DNA-binding transcriptional regulator [Agrococcus jejuensis]SDH61672.1 transcriptional regulator, LacI family [Agrococcus jejuensis]